MALIDLKDIGKPVFYKMGEFIYEEDEGIGDPCIFYLLEGKVELEKKYNPIQKEAFFYEPGDVVGMLEVYTHSRRITRLKTLTDVKAVGLSREEFEHAMVSNMSFTLTSIRLLSKMLRNVNERIKTLPEVNR